MEGIEIEKHDIIKQQPNWVMDFLESIQISQNNENMALMNMTALKIEEVQENLFLEIVLQQSDNYKKEALDFSQGKSKDYPYFESSINLRLWLNNQLIKFSWEENLLSSTDNEESRLKTAVEGICLKGEVKIIESLAEQIKFGKEKGETEEYDFYNYDQALQHFIKELLFYQDSWQQHFFKDKLKFSWKPYLSGPKDLVLRYSFQEYVLKQFGSSFLTNDLQDLPKLLTGQLLEYSEKDLSKFQLLKKELFEYKRLEEKWPKDLLEVVLRYYDKNFASPLHEFDEQIIFIAMRYYGFPFLPELSSNLCFFDDIGEIRPDLTIGDFGGFFDEFFEWKEWVEHILGGRIDLYVSDKSGKNLAIENKIYASDQPNQLERYANFNQRKDSLYYLTLNGEEPSDLGKGNLKDDEFELISYREHILKWLEQCHKEASDIPIVRENIRQYILIIKKLTKQMDDNLKANIDDLLFEEFEAAAYIKERFDNLLFEYRKKFRDSFSEMLRSKLSKMKGLSFQLYDSDAITKKFSHIWIETENPLKLTFGIETFSGNPGGHDNGSLFIGLYRYKTELDDKKLKFNELHPVYWPHHLKLKWKNENDQEITTSLNDANFLKKLFKNKSGFYEKTLEDLTDKSIRFIKETFEILK